MAKPPKLEHVRRTMQARADRLVTEMFNGATQVVATPQEPLTLDKIQRLALDFRAEMGPTPVFLSSKIFPIDKAFSVDGPGEKFTCAHPVFWRRLEHEIAQEHPAPSIFSRPLFGIQILEIDIDDDTSEDRRLYLSAIWERLFEAFKVAMVPLPEWLRPPDQG